MSDRGHEPLNQIPAWPEIIRFFGKQRSELIRFGVLALLSATATTIYLLAFFTSTAAHTVVNTAASIALLLFTITAPGCLAMAVFAPSKISIEAAKVHAALYTAFILVAFAISDPGHGSPGDAIAALIQFILLAILVFELIVVGVAVRGARNLKPHPIETPWIFTGLIAALVGGWGLGVLVWALQVPPQVVATAEAIAQERPYCIDVDGKPARSILDLTGVTMVARSDSGWTWNFHALLVVGEGADRVYFNWSYRKGGFQPVNDRARDRLHLDASVKCRPVKNFARSAL